MMNLRRSRSRRRWNVALGAFWAFATTGLVALAPPQPAASDDPSEKEAERLALQRVVRENCMICHSDEMVANQRLTPKQWKAEVEKMVGWGSPLPKEQQQAVIDFLAASYPADAAPARLSRMTYQEATEQDRPDTPIVALAGDLGHGESAYIKNCANCHGPDGQGAELGPNLVEKPVLLKRAEFEKVIQRGQGRMPAFASTLDAATETDMLHWLRSRRFRPTPPAAK